MTDNRYLKGIILDFDGVIVDSLELHLEAWAHATKRIFGISLTQPEDLKGYATRTIAGILAKRFGDPSLAPSLVKVKEQYLSDNLTHIKLIKGAAEFIRTLAAGCLPYGIASNSKRSFVHPALTASRLEVPVVVCGDEIRRPKPHPDIFLECARKLGFSIKDHPDIFVFEDSEHGIKAATSAKMKAIGVSTMISQERLLKAGAFGVCSNLEDAKSKILDIYLPK